VSGRRFIVKMVGRRTGDHLRSGFRIDIVLRHGAIIAEGCDTSAAGVSPR
jgi:hypothetical protein